MHGSFHYLHLFPGLCPRGGPVSTDGDVDVLTPGRDKGCFGLGTVVHDGVAVIPQQRVVVVHLRAVDGVVKHIRRGRVQFLFQIFLVFVGFKHVHPWTDVVVMLIFQIHPNSVRGGGVAPVVDNGGWW